MNKMTDEKETNKMIQILNQCEERKIECEDDYKEIDVYMSNYFQRKKLTEEAFFAAKDQAYKENLPFFTNRRSFSEWMEMFNFGENIDDIYQKHFDKYYDVYTSSNRLHDKISTNQINVPAKVSSFTEDKTY